MEKPNKLVKPIVNLGEEQPRTLSCSMKHERENPKEIEGKQALFVVNLKSREMFGCISHGMLFAIGYEYGITPIWAMPENPIPNGSRAS